jgi:hypothetical protein
MWIIVHEKTIIIIIIVVDEMKAVKFAVKFYMKMSMLNST